MILPMPALGQQIRVVSYNTANDVGTNGSDSHPPAVGGPATGVFQAIAALNVSGSTRPIDVLALQESVYYTGTGINPTAQGFVTVLNTIYGTNVYAAATLNGTTDGASTGNGPQTLIYRTTTLQLLSQQALGTPSGTGIPRQVMQYKFQPIGYSSSAAFTLFNDHFKSGTTTSDDNRRGVEAGIINSAVNALPANSPIIFAGDYNPTNNTSDQGYHGVITGSSSNHGVDPLNPNNVSQNWSTASSLGMETESPATTAAFSGQSTGGMNYRDDMLLNSPGMLSGSGIHYVNGSFVAFGNTGTHTYQSAVTTGSTTAFAAELSGYTPTQAGTVLSDLGQLSDHLPVVADYSLAAVPEPPFLLAMTGAVFALWRFILANRPSRR
jgi:hypothetical protein